MANNLGYTPGAGANIGTVQASSDGSHAQLVVISAAGATGDRSPVAADPALGLGVQVLAIAGGTTFPVVNNGSTKLVVDASQVAVPVTDNAGSLTVDAPAATPVAVRLSSGSAFVDTIPVSVSGTATVAGTVAISGTPAVAQSGTWNIGTVTTITNTVTVAGVVVISGTPTVQGTVTANQGTPAAIANAWNVKVGDGTNPAGVTNVTGAYALKVDVIKQVGGGYSQQDKTAFTEGTTPVEVIGGVYNDAFGGSPSAGQASVLRITPNRAAHANLRRQDGTEVGTSTNALYVQAATANFPMNVVQIGGNAVVTAAAGIQKVGISDATGTAFASTNPLPVQNAPSSTGIWKNGVTFSASQTDIALRTPAGGKTAFVEGIVITVQTSGVLKIYDQTNAAGNMIYQGTPAIGAIITITPSRPIPLSAANNILRYTTGSGATGDISCWGFDA